MAFGLRPAKKRGDNYNAKGTNTYVVSNGYATALYRGDPVRVSSTGYLVRANNGEKVTGVFWGASYLNTEGQPVMNRFLPASTSLASKPIDAVMGLSNAVAYVLDDVREVFEIQADASVSIGLIGKNFRVSVGTGSNATGLSGANLDISSATVSGGDAASASSATMVRLVGIKEMPGNATAATPTVMVIWNYHQDNFTNA